MIPRVIPFHRPSIGDAELAAVTAVMRSGWLTTGAVTAEFERKFGEYVGAPGAVAVNSCSSGLQLALAALGVGPGDEVITSPLTFCATVLAILHAGATPVLADVGADGNLDPASVESRITPRTKALLPVHLGGNPCDMEALWALARKHGLFVVEDAAHALGAHYGESRIGGDPRSDAVVFSFYATKSLTTGEGGMITTHRAGLRDRLRLLGHHGIDRDAWQRETARNEWEYRVIDKGFKFNLSDMQSAIGLEQLKRQDSFLATRVQYARLYDEELARIEEVGLPTITATARHCRHLYRLALQTGRLTISRDEFIREMKQRGVSCSVHFIPIPLHPFFAAAAEEPENECPRALSLYPRLVSLPIYPAMSADDVRYVAGCVREIVGRHLR
jgi:dTDP-4-amino-4,6-dideoxygalactose transaminase